MWSSCHFIFQVVDMKREECGVAATLYFRLQIRRDKSVEKVPLYISGCRYEERRVWSSWRFLFQVANMKREKCGVAGTLYFRLRT